MNVQNATRATCVCIVAATLSGMKNPDENNQIPVIKLVANRTMTDTLVPDWMPSHQRCDETVYHVANRDE